MGCAQQLDGGNTVSSARSRRRLGIRIDMTPMVDIVFLLLIFYMVTTVFAMPQAMEIHLPETPGELPVAQSKVLTVRVDGQDQLWLNRGLELPNRLGFSQLNGRLWEALQEEPGTVIVLTVHPDARYHGMVDALDEVDRLERVVRATHDDGSIRFAFKAWDVRDDTAIRRAATPTDFPSSTPEDQT